MEIDILMMNMDKKRFSHYIPFLRFLLEKIIKT